MNALTKRGPSILFALSMLSIGAGLALGVTEYNAQAHAAQVEASLPPVVSYVLQADKSLCYDELAPIPVLTIHTHGQRTIKCKSTLILDRSK